MMAMTAAMMPLKMFDRINGRRMKPGVAPTNFMVYMINRRLYAVRRMVLLMSTYDMTINTIAKAKRMKPMVRILSLTDCIKSFWK
jgi:hypothetical protein